jgi:hypothetical protein
MNACREPSRGGFRTVTNRFARSAILFIVSVIAPCLSVPPASAQFADEVMVEMRDHTKLATDVYRYFWDFSEHPVILIRTPYGKRATSVEAAAQYFLYYDYVVVVQDERGTGNSHGTNELFRADGWGNLQDGYDTIDWIASQDWCDGKVGMFGYSALGISAYLAAGTQHPALRAEVVGFAAADMYSEAVYQGGELRAELVDGWVEDQNPDKLPEILDHSVRTSYWDVFDAEARQPLIRVPTLHIGGWYDCFLQGTLNHFAGLQSRGGVGARGNQKLVVGPWTHVNFDSTDQGDLTYPSNSLYSDVLSDATDWFDYWLRGDHGNGALDNRVEYYVMGDVDHSTTRGNRWRTGTTWPPPGRQERLYLWGGGQLWGQAARGLLAMPQIYTYAPLNPAPTRGGATLNVDAGPYDQRSIERRSDVLVYTSPRFTQPLEITGRLQVELYASSSAVDTDWTAKLCDVYPDGRSMLVCDGILRARARDSASSPTLMIPGTIYRFVIDLWSTSLNFNTGHRIRLSISSSNSTRFEANRNNGGRVRSGNFVVARNTVYHDTFRPSALILPVTYPTTQHPVFRQSPTDASRWTLYR